MNEKKSSKHDIVKKVNSQSKKHHFEESGCEEEFNSLFPWKKKIKKLIKNWKGKFELNNNKLGGEITL